LPVRGRPPTLRSRWLGLSSISLAATVPLSRKARSFDVSGGDYAFERPYPTYCNELTRPDKGFVLVLDLPGVDGRSVIAMTGSWRPLDVVTTT
jgi:hypothetical protein